MLFDLLYDYLSIAATLPASNDANGITAAGELVCAPISFSIHTMSYHRPNL